MQSLVADSEIWGSFDVVPGLALKSVPMAALALPAKRTAALAQADSGGTSGGVLWLPCMGPDNPAHLGIPVNPSTSVAVTITMRSLRVCLPPGYERKLLLVMTSNREIELGLRVRALVY